MRQRAVTKPTLVTADLNGMNTLRYTAASTQFFNIPNPMLAGLSACAMYAVIKLANDPPTVGDGGIERIGTDVQADHFPYTDGVVYNGFASTARKTYGNPSPSLAAWRIISIYSAASAHGIYIDGTLFASTVTNTFGVNNTPTFGKGLAAQYTNGWVAEVLFSNANDGTSPRQQIEGYLAHKWGLMGNLPVGHPYKSSPP
jgi:hypothetical protein